MSAGQPWFESVVLTAEEESKVVALEDAVAAAVSVRALRSLLPRRRCSALPGGGQCGAAGL